MILSMLFRLGGEVEEARRVFEEGREIAERSGDRATLALLHGGLGGAVGTCAGDVPEHLRLAEEGARIAEDSGDPALEAAANMSLVYPRFMAGHCEESVEAGDRILELTEEDPQLGAGLAVNTPRAFATSFRALPLMALGRFEEARRALAEGAELCRRWDRESLGLTHSMYGALFGWGADPPGSEMMSHARQAEEIAETLGDAFSRVVSAARLGAAQTRLAELEEAGRSFERSMALIAERGAKLEFEPMARRYRAEGMAASGELEAAIAEGELAVRLADERGVRVHFPGVCQSLAGALIERRGPGDAERAAALLDEADRIARELGTRPDLVKIARQRARLCEVRGDSDGRARELAEALELAHEIDARGLITELESEADSSEGLPRPS
jgi:tetratricopeptide (TPR) repeat protein